MIGPQLASEDYSGVSGKVKWAHHKTGGIAILFFPILLWLFDAYIASFEGLTFSLDSINFQNIIGFFQNSLFLIVAIIYIVIRRPSREELPFFIAVIALFTYIAGFIWYHIWIIVHLFFAIFVYGYFLKGFDKSEPITGAHWMFLIIVIWDMFDFPLIQWININSLDSTVVGVITNTLLFPIWLFYFITFMKEGAWKNTTIILIFIFYIGYIGFHIPGITAQLNEISPEKREAALAAPAKVVQNYFDIWRRWVSGQIQYAITGKVEENQYEQLGVYLENVQSADKRYYENEDVVIWGTVKARTLDDPINIKVGCYVEEGGDKINTENADPKEKFPVFTLEENDFACTFKSTDKKFESILDSGSHTITAFAEFNFETLAFLKVYFMDRERLRAMTRENLDPFEEFDIKDKNPIAIYTNGPAEIGMEATSPLVGVSNSYISFPRLSLSILNRQGWEGEIKGLKELVLLFPKGAEITIPQNDCNRKLVPYGRDACKEKSCKEFVQDECLSVCVNYKGNTRSNCENSCKESFEQCQENCRFLFEEEDQEYSAYALDKSEIDEINKKEDIDIINLRCKFNPNPSEILENTPITTKSIRAKVRYDYIVEKSVTVRIEKIDEERRTTDIGDVAIKGRNEVQQLIIETANANGVDPVMTLAIAEEESNFKHCCRDFGQVHSSDCVTTTEKSCDAARVLRSLDDSSVGVMQINTNNAQSDWFYGTNKYGCNGQTIYDLECNIKFGVGILKEKYEQFSNGIPKDTLNLYCHESIYPDRHKKYLSYRGWWAAARGYNGLACRNEIEANYVDRVEENYNKLKSGTLPQTGFTTIKPPTNLRLIDISNNAKPTVFILWDKSETVGVEGYIISKTIMGTAEETKISVGDIESYADGNVEYEKSYRYKISARSESYESEQTQIVEITLNKQENYLRDEEDL